MKCQCQPPQKPVCLPVVAIEFIDNLEDLEPEPGTPALAGGRDIRMREIRLSGSVSVAPCKRVEVCRMR
jgi:hypothetical protein